MSTNKDHAAVVKTDERVNSKRVIPPGGSPGDLDDVTDDEHGDDVINRKVYLRVRPFTMEELNAKEKLTLEFGTDNVSVNKDGVTTSYGFSHVFGQQATQGDVFDMTALPLCTDLLQGTSGLLICHGSACSGKTYSVIGEPDRPGILPRILDVLFNSIGESLVKKPAQDRYRPVSKVKYVPPSYFNFPHNLSAKDSKKSHKKEPEEKPDDDVVPIQFPLATLIPPSKETLSKTKGVYACIVIIMSSISSGT